MMYTNKTVCTRLLFLRAFACLCVCACMYVRARAWFGVWVVFCEKRHISRCWCVCAAHSTHVSPPVLVRGFSYKYVLRTLCMIFDCYSN